MIFSIRLQNYFYAKYFALMYRYFFGQFGRDSRVIRPLGIEGIANIYLGNKVIVAAQTYLAAVPFKKDKKCELIIEDGVALGRFNHIYATERIYIGKNVITANGVYISDNLHGYEDIKTPIMKQALIQKNHVEIGDGTWIGHGACVIGAKIGKNCVVGANSVVISDAPDFSVLVGAPAKIIKRYDVLEKMWRRTNEQGNFIN